MTDQRDPAPLKHSANETRCVAVSLLWALLLASAMLLPGQASAQFTIAGKKVSPSETNFAGVRQVSPVYGFVVQINHDAQLAADFDLQAVDGAFAKLLREHGRAPLVSATRLIVVVTTGAKIAKFGEAGQRRMFRWLEPELRKHGDFHVSPVAIFISDQAASDRAKLEAVLMRALTLYFDPRLREALDSVDSAPPVDAQPHRH
ncbi:MAG: hypothetical protein HY726_09525 [Candidatus Rokubacteria bacterium]|nr:hypothetical protein [Candidatus Rokubacteria bacterium]